MKATGGLQDRAMQPAVKSASALSSPKKERTKADWPLTRGAVFLWDLIFFRLVREYPRLSLDSASTRPGLGFDSA